ncbi:MAG TPA: arginine deiminase family protein [Gaiellaceae bacterium]|jgi:N-dimethylarginine dimethylaminohydrolase|nr:arginine deiminase family protein [Gaiellaceae bacterium]
MAVLDETRYGCQSQTATLRRVLVRAPRAEDGARWREFGWRAEPDPARLAAEHEGFAAELTEFGAEVVYAEEPLPGALDAIYAYDPALVADAGAILLRPGKELRQGEPAALGRDLERAGVPVAAALEPPGLAEGGDTLWLDERTLLVGLGYRTNEAGAEALRRALPDVDVLTFDLPHYRGAAEVLHLLSFVSPLDRDLALVFPPLAPTRLLQLLAERGVATVEVPVEEYDSLGCNVLALGPRVALALDGNPETRRRLEAAGVDVRVYRGEELSLKGDGGPTCLTRPLLRDDA